MVNKSGQSGLGYFGKHITSRVCVTYKLNNVSLYNLLLQGARSKSVFVCVGLVCLSAHCYNYTAKVQRHFYWCMVRKQILIT